MNPNVSILVPAYNEGRIIYKSLSLLSDFIKTQNIPYEIIVSDDGSWDNTFSEAKRAAHHFEHILCIRHEENKGKGHALKNAFMVSKGSTVIFLDADLDMPPSQLALFFSTFNKEKSDIIIGCKRHPDSVIVYPLKRKIMSWGYSLFLRVLFGLPVRDTQTGMKLFKRKVLQEIFPRILCKRFAYDIEILACAYKYGYKIQELPIIIHYSKEKWSRLGLKTSFQITWDTMAIVYRMYIRKWYQQPLAVIPSQKRGISSIDIRDLSASPRDDKVESIYGN